MVKRHCAVCGRVFEALRRDARYCSPACRQKAYRRRASSRSRQPRRSQAEVTRQRLYTKRCQVYELVCTHCGRTFQVDGTQTGRLYCSDGCKQAAYRKRQAARAVGVTQEGLDALRR